MTLAAHIHQADVRAPFSATYPELNLPMFLTPSVSPIYLNNPGYSVVDLELGAATREKRVSMVNWRFFQLYEYTVTRTVASSFLTINPEELYGIKLGDASSIRKLVAKMQSDSNLFAVYLASKMGYRWLFQQAAGLTYPLAKLFMLPKLHQNFVCAMKYYDAASFGTCEYK
jgi:hypothetical protein